MKKPFLPAGKIVATHGLRGMLSPDSSPVSSCSIAFEIALPSIISLMVVMRCLFDSAKSAKNNKTRPDLGRIF